MEGQRAAHQSPLWPACPAELGPQDTPLTGHPRGRGREGGRGGEAVTTDPSQQAASPRLRRSHREQRLVQEEAAGGQAMEGGPGSRKRLLRDQASGEAG